MRILLDTNLLLRIADESSAHHADAVAAINWLNGQDHEGCLVPQVLNEYWVVATRPLENNGLGLAPDQADAAIDLWMGLFRLLRDERGIFAHWRELVRDGKVQGKGAHDARLVAAMHRHGLTHLLTFNKADFVRYPGITVQTPKEVLSH